MVAFTEKCLKFLHLPRPEWKVFNSVRRPLTRHHSLRPAAHRRFTVYFALLQYFHDIRRSLVPRVRCRMCQPLGEHHANNVPADPPTLAYRPQLTVRKLLLLVFFAACACGGWVYFESGGAALAFIASCSGCAGVASIRNVLTGRDSSPTIGLTFGSLSLIFSVVASALLLYYFIAFYTEFGFGWWR